MEIFSLLYLVFLPLLAGFLIACPKFPNNPVVIRRFAKGFAGVHLIYSLLFLLNFDTTNFVPSYMTELTFFKQSWLQTLGIKASFGADGISLIFLILTSFVTLLALFASKNKITYSHKLYYSMLFVAQTSILGLLCAQDMFVFFFFMELSLIPLYFLISHWSKNEDEKMSRKFLGFNIFGGFFVLAPMLILYFYNFAITGTLTAGIETLNLDNFSYPDWFKIAIFSSFLVGFWIRSGVFPFHNWFIECIDTAKIPVSMLLITCFAPSGIYGILRFNMGAFPETFTDIDNIVFPICLIGIIYIVMLLTTEKNLKKIFGYFSVIQNSLILISLSALNSLTYNAAILLSVASSITICGLLVLALILERREKTYLIPLSNCLANKMPKYKIFAYFIFFSAICTPCLLGFVPMLLMTFGIPLSETQSNNFILIMTFLCAFALVITYIYLISAFHQMLFSNSSKENTKARDITLSEMTMLGFITLAILFFGLSPMSLINLINSASHFAVNVFGI